jgi:hypothetical protein
VNAVLVIVCCQLAHWQSLLRQFRFNHEGDHLSPMRCGVAVAHFGALLSLGNASPDNITSGALESLFNVIFAPLNNGHVKWPLPLTRSQNSPRPTPYWKCDEVLRPCLFTSSAMQIVSLKAVA